MNECIFIRLTERVDKQASLMASITFLQAEPTPIDLIHVLNPVSFRQIPRSPFAYWVSESVRSLFRKLPPFESSGRDAQIGASTKNDFRFLRAKWEVSPGSISRSRAETFSKRPWAFFAKGGSYASYYADITLVINWADDGEVLKQTISEYRGSRGWGYQWSAALNGYSLYFRSGLTWSRRSQRGLSLRALPEGCIFADKGPAAFCPKDSLLPLLATMNSTAFKSLVSLQMAFGSYEVGVIQRTPVPDLSGVQATPLAELARSAIDLNRSLETANETSQVFQMPALLQFSGYSLNVCFSIRKTTVNETVANLDHIKTQIDEIAFDLYSISGQDRRLMESQIEGSQIEAGDEEDLEDEEQELSLRTSDDRSLVAELVSYCVGCALGRWDVRFATKDRPLPELPDPFAPLPLCSPGMLQGPDGLPLYQAPVGYPLRLDEDYILGDDSDHPDDIIRRTRDVLELIWKDRADAIERDACKILGVAHLRDYFRKPGKGGFWDDHIGRYSNSRRKAPIYWLLQSSKKNYALWVYYHRLDKDILFKALLNYVEPKIRKEEARLDELRSQKSALGSAAKGAKKFDKDIDRQEAFLSELRDFEDKLRRAANLHLDPDLNDGVVLNIAPLRELVPWKEAKSYWDDLMDGKYEWSSIAKQLREKGLVK